MGDNNQIWIHKSARLRDVTFWIEEDNNRIEVGERVTTAGEVHLAACEGRKITIGEDCMFSSGIKVVTTDSHSILDGAGRRINPGQDVVIGDHVWIGMQCLILKGAVIGDNDIIAARSVVSRTASPGGNSVWAGTPAKVIKRNVNWKRERI